MHIKRAKVPKYLGMMEVAVMMASRSEVVVFFKSFRFVFTFVLAEQRCGSTSNGFSLPLVSFLIFVISNGITNSSNPFPSTVVQELKINKIQNNTYNNKFRSRSWLPYRTSL